MAMTRYPRTCTGQPSMIEMLPEEMEYLEDGGRCIQCNHFVGLHRRSELSDVWGTWLQDCALPDCDCDLHEDTTFEASA